MIVCFEDGINMQYSYYWSTIFEFSDELNALGGMNPICEAISNTHF